MEKDFSNPKKLGPIRLLEVLWIINIFGTFITLILLKKGQWDLDFEEWRGIFNIMLEGIALWLIWQRKAVTRHVIIGFAALSIILGTGHELFTSVDFDLVEWLSSSAFDIILIVYFATSRRAKAVFTQPFSAEIDQKESKEQEGYFQWRTWPFWRNLILFYCLFSVAGHWMEAAFCLLVKYGYFPGVYDPTSQIWSDYLFPFPVYGVGFCACVLLFFPLKQWLRKKFKGLLIPLVLSFVANTIVCAGIELALGLATNMPAYPGGPLPLWDYSYLPFNFMGQICLLYSSAFGVASTFVTWVVYPAIMKGIGKVSREGMNIAFVAIIVGYAMLVSMYFIQSDYLDDLVKNVDQETSKDYVTYVEHDENGDIHTYRVEEPSQDLIDAIKADSESAKALEE